MHMVENHDVVVVAAHNVEGHDKVLNEVTQEMNVVMMVDNHSAEDHDMVQNKKTQKKEEEDALPL